MEVRLNALERWTWKPVHGITVMNDTGSTVLSLLDLGLTQLGGWSSYLGYAALMHMVFAAGKFETLPSFFRAHTTCLIRLLTPTTKLAAQHAILKAAKGYKRQLLLRLESECASSVCSEENHESDCSNPSPAANNVV